MKGEWIHRKPHPLKGKKVVITLRSGKPGHPASGKVGIVDDWFDRRVEDSWKSLFGDNKLATEYARRRRHANGVPNDDEVVIVKVDGGLLLVHDTEMREEDGQA